MDPLRMFIPLTKVDAETRTVYGIATGETVDRSGEICDYASTKPLYEAWSGDIAKASGGKSFGNVRAMHGKVAAGKVTAITFNDTAKQIEIAAKIVDEAEWTKVQEGVYTGFSQGGAYEKRWTDKDGLQRYTASPSEVSLVDLPCLPTATFQMIKAAGAAEERHFAKSVQVEVAVPSNADVNAKAMEMAKAAGRETAVADFFAPAREALMKAALPALSEAKVTGEILVEPAPTNVADGVEQVWKAADGSTFAKKADALARAAELAAAPGTKAVLDALGELGGKLGIAKGDQGGDAPGNGTKKPGEGKDQADGGGASAMNANSFTPKKTRVAPDGSTMKAATAASLAKDLYTASRFAELLSNLRGMAMSAEWDVLFGRADADDADLAAKMKAWVAEGCSMLVAIVQSEADDLDPDTDDGNAMAMAAGALLKPGAFAALSKAAGDVPKLARVLAEMEKRGARNSKADQDKIQAMHDHAMDLGATCDKGNCGDDASKSAGGDLTKALTDMTADRDLAKARGDALQKTLDDQILPMLKAIGAKVDNIEKQPLPFPLQNGGTRVVSKGGDDEALAGDLADRLAKMKAEDPEGYTLLMIQAAQRNPQPLSYAR